jgi:hypothetical protein
MPGYLRIYPRGTAEHNGLSVRESTIQCPGLSLLATRQRSREIATLVAPRPRDKLLPPDEPAFMYGNH